MICQANSTSTSFFISFLLPFTLQFPNRNLLSKIDYHYEPDELVPERHFFIKPPLNIPYRTHHLSVTAEYSTFWRNNLAFREYMRSHPDEIKKYGELKINFALKYPDNRGLYTEAKQPYIKKILKKALLEFEQKQIQQVHLQ